MVSTTNFSEAAEVCWSSPSVVNVRSSSMESDYTRVASVAAEHTFRPTLAENHSIAYSLARGYRIYVPVAKLDISQLDLT